MKSVILSSRRAFTLIELLAVMAIIAILKEFMTAIAYNSIVCGLAVLLLSAMALSAIAQTFAVTNWVIDPFSPSSTFGLTGANSSSPCFTNNGVERGTLYANSPIGATLKLAKPGDTISCTGQVTLSGNLNADGNLQFRLGLYYRGDNTTDINWLGYMFGNITGTGNEATTGLYVRNNPNPGIYASGYTGNAMRPKCENVAYVPGWGSGTYNFSFSVTLLPASCHQISWKLAANQGTYSYTGTYTNRFALTVPPAFDQVGMMGGVALFNSASPADIISFKNVTVTLKKAGDTH
jgi:prepilin-type N-terminal cleavage/methylation domain-containing protein